MSYNVLLAGNFVNRPSNFRMQATVLVALDKEHPALTRRA
jgi:hypothetical protein